MIVQADVAGEQQGRLALGCTRILDPDGAVLAAADSQTVGIVIADTEPHSRPFDPRGWDGRTNAAESREYAPRYSGWAGRHRRRRARSSASSMVALWFRTARLMGDDANHRVTSILGWLVAGLITLLNVVLIYLTAPGSASR